MDELLPKKDFDDGLARGGRIFLWVYLMIHSVVLPLALGALARRLPAGSISDAYVNFIYYAFGAAVIFAVTWRAFRVGFDALCDRPLACVYAVLLGYMLLMALMYLASLVVSLLPDALKNVDNLNNDTVAGLADQDYDVTAAMAVFLAPLVEEPLFRGGVFGTVRRKSRAWAYILSAGLFALYHVWQYAAAYGDPLYLLMAVEYLPAGVALCWAYERTGSIWSPIFLHAMVNAMSLLSLKAVQGQG